MIRMLSSVLFVALALVVLNPASAAKKPAVASSNWLPRHPCSILTVEQTTFYIERIECNV